MKLMVKNWEFDLLKPSSSPAMPENNETTGSLLSWQHLGSGTSWTGDQMTLEHTAVPSCSSCGSQRPETFQKNSRNARRSHTHQSSRLASLQWDHGEVLEKTRNRWLASCQHAVVRTEPRNVNNLPPNHSPTSGLRNRPCCGLTPCFSQSLLYAVLSLIWLLRS